MLIIVVAIVDEAVELKAPGGYDTGAGDDTDVLVDNVADDVEDDDVVEEKEDDFKDVLDVVFRVLASSSLCACSFSSSSGDN